MPKPLKYHHIIQRKAVFEPEKARFWIFGLSNPIDALTSKTGLSQDHGESVAML
jgi:hypothetical protein